MNHRLVILGTTLALSLPVVTASAPAAAKYPSKAKQTFNKGCVKAAKKEGASSSQAKTYCSAALKCLEKNLSFSDFKDYDAAVSDGDKSPPHRRVVNRCVKQAAKTL